MHCDLEGSKRRKRKEEKEGTLSFGYCKTFLFVCFLFFFGYRYDYVKIIKKTEAKLVKFYQASRTDSLTFYEAHCKARMAPLTAKM